MTKATMVITLVWSSVAPTAAELIITDLLPGTFVDISSSGFALGYGDDGVAEVVPGLDLTQTMFSEGGGRVWISNNGAIGFLPDGSSGAYYRNAEIPSFALFGGGHGTPQALAVYWDDLDSDTGDVYHGTFQMPGGRRFIVQWHNRPHYPGDIAVDGDEATLQVQVPEHAGFIKAQFLYGDVDFLDPGLDGGASATIGYQAGGSGNNVQWSFDRPGSVSAGSVLTLMELPGPCTTPGDGNGDCHIDATELIPFEICLAGPATAPLAACECYDLNSDGRVDLADYAAFQVIFTGSTATVPGCVPDSPLRP